MCKLVRLRSRFGVAVSLAFVILVHVPVNESVAQSQHQSSPIDQLKRTDKTELTDAFSNVATIGGEFGLSWMWWWHRKNAAWGTVRPEVAKLIVFDEQSGEAISIQGGQRIWQPDHLEQTATVNGLTISEDRAVLGDSVVDILRFRNTGRQPRSLKLYFVGHPDPHSPGKTDGRGLSVSFQKSANWIRLEEEKDYGRYYPPGPIQIHQVIGASLPISGWAVGSFNGDVEKLIGRDLGYGSFINDANVRKYVDTYSADRFEYIFQIDLFLDSAASKDLTLATTIGTDYSAVARSNPLILANARGMMAASDKRWKDYFGRQVPVFESPDSALNRLWYYIWYVLRSNSVRHGEAVKADFTVPTKYGYWGCYIWDSAFHALGQSHLQDPAVAKNSLLAVFSLQYPNGFIPVNAGADAIEVNTQADGTYDLDPADFYRYTETSDPYIANLEYHWPQPHQWGVPQKEGTLTIQEKTMIPILGVAAWRVYLTTGDANFLSEAYAHLSRYDDWLWHRRNTGDGLLVYYNPEESGWDNATRLLPLPVKSVDGSTMAYLLRKMLSESAAILNRPDDAARFKARADITAHSIEQKMWSAQDGFFYDLSMDDSKRSEATPAGFTPLMAGIVSPAQAARLAGHLKSRTQFASPAPIPSISMDDPAYDTRTWGWNGPSWIPTNWLVIESFARAGMTAESNWLMRATEEEMSKPNGWPSAFEQYNSQDGTGFGVPDYSWSGAINDYLVTWVAGVQPDAGKHNVIIEPHFLGPWTSFTVGSLRIGQNVIGYHYEKRGSAERLEFSNSGPDHLKIEFFLAESGAPREVRVNGTPAPPSSWQFQDGMLHVALPQGGDQALEIVP